MTKFPKILHIKIERDGTTPYFVADEDAALLVDMGEKIRVAKYQLVEISEARGVAIISKTTKARK